MKKKIFAVIAVLALVLCSITYKSTRTVLPEFEKVLELTKEDGLRTAISSKTSGYVSVRLGEPATMETFPDAIREVVRAAEESFSEDNFPKITVTLDEEEKGQWECSIPSKTVAEISATITASDDNNAQDFNSIVHLEMDTFADLLADYQETSQNIRYELSEGVLSFQSTNGGLGIVSDERLEGTPVTEFNSWDEFDAVSWEIDTSFATLNEKLISSTDEMIGEGEEIVDIRLESDNLIIIIDLNGATGNLPTGMVGLADARAARITDKILKMRQFDTLWNTITLDFVDVGYVECRKIDVRTNEYGRYFPSFDFQYETTPSTDSKTSSNSSSRTSASTTSEPGSTNQTVYITRTGKRYHYDPNCNGGIYITSTLSAAKTEGLTPCQKCVG